MRLNLEGLDARGIELAFGESARERRIALGTTKGLRGALTKTEDSLRLSDVAAESVGVRSFVFPFETFSLSLGSEGSLGEIRGGNYERHPGRTDIQLAARTLHAPELSVQFASLEVRGELRAENVRLHIEGSERRIVVDLLVIDGLSLSGSVAFRAERLIAKDVQISWGSGGYRVQLGELELPTAAVELKLPGTRSSGDQKPGGPTSKDAPPRTPLLSWDVLDGLSGSVDVDVLVDMKVPVIGSRRAKHPFRVSIESGAVNYLDLERNLAPLEDAFLDFAVREGALVLERGIPLWPTRGRGKPIVVWALSDDDLALAAEDRVRLAVLPRARLAASGESSPPESDSPSFALRELGFLDMQAFLRLARGPTRSTAAPLRDLSFEELQVQGTIHHRADGEPRPGQLTGKLHGLRGRIARLALGTSHLDVGALELDQLSSLLAVFQDIHPESVKFGLAGWRASALSIGKRVE